VRDGTTYFCDFLVYRHEISYISASLVTCPLPAKKSVDEVADETRQGFSIFDVFTA